MSKLTQIDEVQVLRFFETGSLGKAEAVFNIISEKMRERLRDRQSADADHLTEKVRPIKKRTPADQVPPPGLTEHSE